MLKVFVATALLFFGSAHSEKQRYSIFTESLHPVSYVENGIHKGIILEITQAVFKEAGLEYEVDSLPWARAYYMVQQKPNSFVVPLIFSEARAQKFHWIGPLLSFQSYFYKLKKRHDIQVNSWDDLKKYRIGVVNQHSSHQLLEQHDVNNELFIAPVNNKTSNLKKLLYGRVELIPSLPFTLQKTVQQEGLTMDDLEATIPIKQNDYYLGVNLASDPALIQKLRLSLTRLQSSGALQKILASYPEAMKLLPTTEAQSFTGKEAEAREILSR